MQVKTKENDSRQIKDRLFGTVYVEENGMLFALQCNHPIHILHSNLRPRYINYQQFNQKHCLGCEHLFKKLVR